MGAVLIIALSLLAVAAVIQLQELAIWVALLLTMAIVTLWRPQFGLYAVVLLTVMFDPRPDEPIAYLGWLTQSNISTWSPLTFISFSPVELLVVATAIGVVVRAVVERRALRGPHLSWLLIVFSVLVMGSIGWGVINRGSLNIALWETRSMLLAVALAFLVPNVITDRRQIDRLLSLMCIAVVVLSLDVIWRRYTLLAGVRGLDLAYAHETPVIMNVAVVLLVSRLVWPASVRARLAILIVPLILFAQMVTERRAGWVGLDIGLILIVIFIFRLKRKFFFLGVVPLLVLYVGYLGVFWNAQGPLAQPARAVRSLSDPDGRDMSSNVYRIMERLNVRQNILAHPVTGLGFGQPYYFYYPLPDLSANWPFYRYIAHVNVLWLWMKMGTLGFIVLLTIIGAYVTHGVQALKRATNTRSASTLVALVSALLMILVYAYVDLALTNVRCMVLLGFVVGAIGAWRNWETSAEGGQQ